MKAIATISPPPQTRCGQKVLISKPSGEGQVSGAEEKNEEKEDPEKMKCQSQIIIWWRLAQRFLRCGDPWRYGFMELSAGARGTVGNVGGTAH